MFGMLACSSAHAEFLDGNTLLQHLRASNVVDRAMALGYVQGVSDAGYTIAHCAPGNMTAGQLQDMVKAYLEATPSGRHQSADVIIMEMLRKAFPCPARGRGT